MGKRVNKKLSRSGHPVQESDQDVQNSAGYDTGKLLHLSLCFNSWTRDSWR